MRLPITPDATPRKRRFSAPNVGRNVRRRLAEASGATLGYIAGNLPGAALGYQAAGAAYDAMERRNSLPQNSRPMSRRHSMSTTVSSRRASVPSLSVRSSAGSSRKSASRYTQSKVKSGGKKRKTSSRKSVAAKRRKLKKLKFARAVKNVLEGEQIVSKAVFNDGLRCSYALPNAWTYNTSANRSWDFFTPAKYLDVAAQLWEGKPYGATGYNLLGLTAPANWPPNQKIHVIDSHVACKVTNDTKFQIQFEFWLFYPKEDIKWLDTSAGPPVGGSNNVAATGVFDLYASYDKEVRTSIGPVFPNATAPLMSSPYDSKFLLKNFRPVCKKMHLQPGEFREFLIDGHKHRTIDFSKLTSAAVGGLFPYYCEHLKGFGSCAMFTRYRTIMEMGSLGGVIESSGGSIHTGSPLIELREFYKMSMPSTAAVTNPTPCIAYYDHLYGLVSGTTVVENEANPQQGTVDPN